MLHETLPPFDFVSSLMHASAEVWSKRIEESRRLRSEYGRCCLFRCWSGNQFGAAAKTERNGAHDVRKSVSVGAAAKARAIRGRATRGPHCSEREQRCRFHTTVSSNRRSALLPCPP